MTGLVSYLSGLSAEDAVAAHYRDAGYREQARRWRGQGCELDLVMRGHGLVVFVEVKRGRSHAAAAARIGPRQAQRLTEAAAEYLAGLPDGQDTDCRFDAALVDRQGRIELIENALA